MLSALNRRLGLWASILGALVLMMACGGGDTPPPPQLSSARAIIGFTIGPASGVINESQHTVAVEVPSDSNLTSLTPTITLSAYATVSPASGQSHDFSSPTTYTVTAQDKSTQPYIITVTKALPRITAFTIGSASGVISESQGTVSLTVPAVTDITSLTPTITLSAGATVSPLSGVSQDFTNPVTYTVSGPSGDHPYIVSVFKAPAAISAADLNVMLGIGINLGNTLDAVPNEGSWAAPAQESYFTAYKAVGFTSVRIPITWNTHFGASTPYTIDPTYLARVKTVANWGTSRGLAIVINSHHDDWVWSDYTNAIPRFEALWTQISTEFKDWPSTLAFEIKNEPRTPMTDAQVNDMNARILAIIRRTNPTRVVIIGANSYNSMGNLMNADFTVPDDPYLIATYHYYNPWNFCGQAAGTWGSASDIATVSNDMVSLKNWGIQHSIPLYMGEYGAILQYNSLAIDAPSRLLWYQTVCQQAHDNGIASAAWDDSGDFGIFHRAAGTWETPILDAIMLR